MPSENDQGQGYFKAEETGVTNPIVVLPCGGLPGQGIPDWSYTDLLPYTTYMKTEHAVAPLFGSFLFNGIQTREHRYIFPLYVGFGEPADQTDWLDWIEHLFSANLNLEALQQAAALDEVDVWISLPYPHPMQTQFGTVAEQMLTFDSEQDRIDAVLWWVEQFLQRWAQEKARYPKLRLRGFQWQRESIDSIDEPIVKAVNQAIAQTSYQTIWLANYGSYGVDNWKSLGFTNIAIHSNYTGNTTHDFNWIHHAANYAKYYHTGLQITYGKGMIYSDGHFIDYLNFGLPWVQGYMSEVLVVFQFPNQTLSDIIREHPEHYDLLFAFLSGTYTWTSYPGMPY